MVVVIQNDPLVPPGLFGRTLDQLGVNWQCCRADETGDFPAAEAVIILGGTMGVNDELAFPFLRPLKLKIKQWLVAELPLLGICLGGQLLAQVADGGFRSASHGEHGVVCIEQTVAGRADPLFSGLPARMPVFQWHDDSFLAPPNSRLLAVSSTCPGQAFRTGNAWGLQFHPEVDRTIVEAWGNLLPGAERYVQQYLSCAGELADRSRQLLTNFLSIVVDRSKSRYESTPEQRG